ncbi:unnamed protein product [Linum tenue]|nr:unnamed protein product [Linum tenue]
MGSIASPSSPPFNASFSSYDRRGHFVVYTMDKSRYTIPLKFLKNEAVLEILRMSKEEFGFSSSKPIVLPFDTFVMDQVISLIFSQQNGDKVLEQVHRSVMATTKGCSSSNQSSFIPHHSCQSLFVLQQG